MKRIMIVLLIETIYNSLVAALGHLSERSSSSVDDKIVQVIKDSKSELIDEMKRVL